MGVDAQRSDVQSQEPYMPFLWSMREPSLQGESLRDLEAKIRQRNSSFLRANDVLRQENQRMRRCRESPEVGKSCSPAVRRHVAMQVPTGDVTARAALHLSQPASGNVQ